MSAQWWLILFCIVMLLIAARVMSQDEWDKAGTMAKKWYPVKQRGGTSMGEEKCRVYLETLFKRPFPKVRPPFLFNPVTKSTLELDGYCEPLKLAFEFNGRQHYEYSPHFHKNKTEFYNGQYRDEMKRKLCIEQGIHLLTVPHDCKNIEHFLRMALEKAGKFPSF